MSAKKIKNLLLGLLGKDGEEEKKKGRFEIMLDEMVEKHHSVIIGHVHMVNLRDLIIKSGKDLEETLKRAKKIAEAVFNEHLEEGDVFAHGKDGEYYLLLPGMSEKSGELKCVAIGDHIKRLLIAEVPVLFKFEIVNAVGTVDRKNLNSAMVWKSTAKKSAKYVNKKRRVPEGRETKRMEHAILASTRRKKMAPDKFISAASDEEADKTEPNPNRPVPKDISVIYGTIWNVKTKLLTAHNCILMVREADERTVRFTLKHRAEHHRQTLFALDQFTQRKATARLRKLLDSGQEALVVLPVHFVSVDQDTSSFLYQHGLTDLSEAERHHIVLELVDPPPYLPGIRIRRIIRTMRRAARTVMVRVPIDSKNLDSWRDTGVHAVGFDLGTLQTDQQMLLPKLEKFAKSAEENGLGTFIYGLNSVSVATMAVSAGFDYIEGDAVCAPVKSLENVRPFETKDLLAHLLPSGESRPMHH